jgi:hypothetical protein
MKNPILNQKSVAKSKKHREAYLKWLQGEIDRGLKKINSPQFVQASKERELNNYQSR